MYIRDSDGVTRRVRRYRPSAAAAKRALQDHLTKRTTPGAGHLTGSSRLSDAVQAWLDTAAKRGRQSEQTLRVYRSGWTAMAPLVGALRLTEVTAGGLTTALEALAQDRPGQVKNAYACVRHGLSHAVRAGALRASPAHDVELPQAKRQEVRALTDDEANELLRLAREHRTLRDEQGRMAGGPRPTSLLPDVVQVLLGTGLRPGEALGLRWQDVDLDGDPMLITVNGTLVGNSAKRQPWTKTSAGHRTLAVPSSVVAVLKRRRQEAKEGDGPVFATRTGRHVSTANLRRIWRTAVEGTRLEFSEPRSCRKTVATRIERTLGIRAAAEQLGHASPGVTEAHYVERRRVRDHRDALEG